MLVIGLVGGIASGKSFVSECFQRLGSEVLNADKIGHDVLETPEVIQAITTSWPSVDLINQKISRKSLARIVFGSDDGQALEILEKITHPRIGSQIQESIDQHRANDAIAVVLDAPILFKAGWQKMCQRIVFIDTDLETRIKRATSRGWDCDEIVRRERFQTGLTEKREQSTDIINNNGTRQETQSQIRKLWIQWQLPLPAETITSPAPSEQTN